MQMYHPLSLLSIAQSLALVSQGFLASCRRVYADIQLKRWATRVLHNRIPEDPRASHTADTVEIFHDLHSCHAEIEILDQPLETKGQELIAMSSKARGRNMDKEQKKRWDALVKVGLDIVRSNETDEGKW